MEIAIKSPREFDPRGERRRLSELLSLTEGVYDASDRRRKGEDGKLDHIRFRLVAKKRGGANLLPLEFRFGDGEYTRRTAGQKDLFAIPISWLGRNPSDREVARLPAIAQECLPDILGLIHEALFRVLLGERQNQ
ncbi:MAG: hypothetical protein AAB869_02960 [Patescibacteria group bacterium]